MNIQKELYQLSLQDHLPMLAKGIVEGFISGMHKSPYHGFSSEFSEHKIYNEGESIKHIDWKRYAKTEKLYIKRYEEESNMCCHIIIDNSSSMHFPESYPINLKNINKIGFAALSTAVIINLLKKQGDAVGMSVYSNTFEYYAPEKGSERHFKMLYDQLTNLLKRPSFSKTTETYTYLHHIAEKIPRRSIILLFTDMFQNRAEKDKLFDALRHLRYNKHEVILFHTFYKEEEKHLNFENRPTRFVDIETNQVINTFLSDVKDSYDRKISEYFRKIKLKCNQYKIDYVETDISEGIEQVLNTYMRGRQKIR